MSRNISEYVFLDIANVCGIGMRDYQQDSFAVSDVTNDELCRNNGVIAVLADGMGGMESGEQFSRLAVTGMLEAHSAVTADIPRELLLPFALRRTMQKIGDSLKDIQNGGTTLIAAHIIGNALYFASVGDSRISLYRKDGLIRLTREHNSMNERTLDYMRGLVPLCHVLGDDKPHALTSFIGANPPEFVDFMTASIELMKGDKVVLMSDGVFNALSDAALCRALKNPPAKAAAAIAEAITAAQCPAQDNYTAIILEYRP